MTYTLGSLFDGSGGFPLAGIHAGFDPVWASEIEPFPIRVTTARLPQMEHLGDVSKINGGDVRPVDVVTFGSPCLAEDTLVLTEEGFKPIKDVQIGERVVDCNGDLQKVINSGQTGVKPLYSLKAMSAHEIKATEDHMFLVRESKRLYLRRRHTYQRIFSRCYWKPLKDISDKDYLGLPVNNESKIPEWEGVECRRANQSTYIKKELDMTDPDLWYLAGRFLGDGWTRTRSSRHDELYGIIICCGKHKAEKFEAMIPDEKFHYVRVEERTVFKYQFSGKELAKFCSQFGKGAENKFVPKFVMDLPVGLLEQFLNGYFDSDGYCNERGVYAATSVSEKLIYGMAQVVMKVYHQPCSVYKYTRSDHHTIEGRVVNQKPTYHLKFKKETKSQDHAFYQDGFVWIPIRSIEKTDEVAPVYDLTVEDTHSFTANGIIVHNCQNLSVCGNREGLIKGEQSKLFFEAVRIIKEMRAKTNGKYPKFIVWENVCFEENTLITCEDGYKRIQDVKVGDKVKTHTGDYKPVVKVHQTKRKPLLKLKVGGSEDLFVTPNHPFLAVRKIYQYASRIGVTDPKWTQAKNLTKEHLIGYRIDKPTLPDDFITEEEAWAVGRWIADGSVDLNKSNPRMFFSIGNKKIEDARNHLYQLPYKIHENKPHATATNFCFTSHEFYALIADAGKGASNKRIPSYVFKLPFRLQKCVLQGYIAGDGYIRTRGKNTELSASTASRELAYGLARLIRNVYRVASGLTIQKTKNSSINGREIHANYPTYCVNASLTSKMSTSVIGEDIVWQPVKSVEDTNRKATVYNLSVLDDNTYEANNIIVHNCGAFSSNNGADFQRVLQEICEIAEQDQVSIPRPSKWQKAGCVLGDRYSIAWRTLDAQYWGVPQRRKRIFLVADLTGQRATEIFTHSESLPRNPAQSQSEAQGTASTSGGSADSSSSGMTSNEERLVSPQIFGTLAASQSQKLWLGNQEAFSGNYFIIENHGMDDRYKITESGTFQTLSKMMGTGGNNTPLVIQEYEKQDSQSEDGLNHDDKDQSLVCKSDKIIRRITPLECCRLQGFPDHWCDDLVIENPTPQQLFYWSRVWAEWNKLNDKKPKTENQVKKWLATPPTDAAQYKMWGNGVALPCVEFILESIREALDKENHVD